MVEQSNAPRNRNSGRSPSYPEIDLGQALEKARQLWEHEKQNLAPIKAIESHWGYKEGTGTARRAVAALKSFGLLEYTGRSEQRKASLTDLAVRIILDGREPSPDRDIAIQQAALNPGIHSEIWNEYKGSLPSDQTLSFKLITERGFSERGANSLISELRRTIEFAKLTIADDMSHREAAVSDDDWEFETSSADEPAQTNLATDFRASRPPFAPADTAIKQVGGRETRTVTLPLLNDGWAVLEYRYPLTEADWASMMAVLAAMKPSLVAAKDSPSERSTDDQQDDIGMDRV